MNARKKILFVITKSVWGGAGRYVYDLALGLPRDEFEVTVAAPESGRLPEKLKAAGVRCIPLSFTQNRNFLFTLFTFGSLFSLVSLLKRERPEIIHLNSAKAGGLGAVAGRLMGVPKIIFTVHGWSFLEDRNPVITGCIYFFSWLTALLSHTIITISDYDFAIAKRMPFVGRKAVRIYNGIAPMDFGSGEIVRDAFPSGAKITGTIGELTANKNQIALIEKARENSEMHVAIVGEGEDRQFLESKIREYGLKDRVKLFGFLPATEVMRGFDVFALPSLKEGLPYVLLEAKAAGLPIKANPVGGVGEILVADIDFSLERMVRETATLYR